MLPNADQWKRWSLPSKYALVGLILSLIGILIALPSLAPEATTKVQRFALFNELFSNNETLAVCVEQPQCASSTLSYSVTRQAFDEHFEEIASEAYGEETHLVEIVASLNRASRQGTILRSEARTLRFQNLFLIWYLQPNWEKKLSDRERNSFTWRLPIKDCVNDGSTFVVYDGKPVTCFLDYLGYLD